MPGDRESAGLDTQLAVHLGCRTFDSLPADDR